MDPIYVLREKPSGAVTRAVGRYIGVTAELPGQRLREHLYEAGESGKRTHKLNWLRSLEQSPTVEVIEWVLPMHREEREKYWIALFRDYGHKLTNSTDGGEGVIGLKQKPNPERNAKVSAALRGVLKSPEHVAAAAAGRAVARIQRLAAGEAPKKHSLETRKRMSLAKIGKPKSEITRKNMSAAQKLYAAQNPEKKHDQCATMRAAAFRQRKVI